MHSARDEDRTTLERAEPAHQSGLDVVSESPIVASLGREHAGQIGSSFRCPSRRRMRIKESLMENIFLRCVGLDVHKASVEACVRRMEPSGRLHQQTSHWGTMTRDILIMPDWMAAQGVTHLAMEPTGGDSRPILTILHYPSTSLLI